MPSTEFAGTRGGLSSLMNQQYKVQNVTSREKGFVYKLKVTT